MQSHKKFIVLFLVLFGVLGVGFDVFALETTWPRSPNGILLDDSTTLSGLVAYLYGWMIAIGGLAAFSVIVFAGVQYLTSAGDPGKTKGAKDKITSAVGGLLLLLSTVLILNVINPELTILTSPSFTPDSQTLDAIDFGDEPNISAPCENVTIRSSSDPADPFSVVLEPGDKQENFLADLGWSPHAFDLEGACRVNLYTNSDCGGDATLPLIADIPDIGVTGLTSSEINCVSVED